jgi:hypothetical protein
MLYHCMLLLSRCKVYMVGLHIRNISYISLGIVPTKLAKACIHSEWYFRRLCDCQYVTSWWIFRWIRLAVWRSAWTFKFTTWTLEKVSHPASSITAYPIKRTDRALSSLYEEPHDKLDEALKAAVHIMAPNNKIHKTPPGQFIKSLVNNMNQRSTCVAAVDKGSSLLRFFSWL